MIRRRLLSLEPLRLAAGVSAFLGPVVFGIGFEQAHRFLFRAGADLSDSFKLCDSKGADQWTRCINVYRQFPGRFTRS